MKYEQALHGFWERVNKLDKSNERKIIYKEIVYIKSKLDMPKRTNEALDTEFVDCIF